MAIIVSINYWAVLVCSIVSIVLGSLWYGPLFGKPWIKIMGFKKSSMDAAKKKGMAASYFTAFVSSFVMNYILAHFVDYTESATWLMGMQTGFWIWLGFLATTMIGIMLWEGRPFKLYAINAGHYLVALVINGSILAIWP